MPEYMLLLHASPPDPPTDRWEQLPLWQEVTETLRDAGLLVANGPLDTPETARTVRVRGGETLVTDGPYAVTKEVLVGYYLLDCPSLDEAIAAAARMPTAASGTVEVRAILDAASATARR